MDHQSGLNLLSSLQALERTVAFLERQIGQLSSTNARLMAALEGTTQECSRLKDELAKLRPPVSNGEATA